MNQTITKEKMAYLEFSLIEGIGSGQAARWCLKCGTPVEILEKPERLIAGEGRPGMRLDVQKAVESVSLLWRKGRMSEVARRVLETCKEENIGWLTWEDAAYPEYLREIADPPVVLYYRGDLDMIHRVCVSIVGSRKAGAYGQKAAYEVAAEAAKAGITVVSGLAVGVDACAHKGAMDAGGNTVAVMPCGLDLCYPKSNAWLYHRICQSNLAVSEYPPGRKAQKWHFVERNRLVSGLSVATVVAQAGPKSGSIRTAQLAAEQGREVFGVPGDIFDLEYLGVHNLIQDGANVLTSPQGFVKAISGQVGLAMASEKKLGHSVVYEPKRKSSELSAADEVVRRQRKEMASRERAGKALWLYEKLDEFGCLPERLCELTGRSAAQVQQAITLLEMQGLVVRDQHQRITKA